jgi:hypothetical protein
MLTRESFAFGLIGMPYLAYLKKYMENFDVSPKKGLRSTLIGINQKLNSQEKL